MRDDESGDRSKINQWQARIRMIRPSVEETGTIALPLASIVNEMADVLDMLLSEKELLINITKYRCNDYKL